jgi:RNA polymerase sigma factor (sigma-70 family)
LSERSAAPHSYVLLRARICCCNPIKFAIRRFLCPHCLDRQMKLCTRLWTQLVEFRPQLEPSTAQIGLAILLNALRRAATWTLPRNWSSVDWNDEIRQIALVAAFESIREHNGRRDVVLGAFVYQRVMGKILTQYRRERRYSFQCSLSTSCHQSDYSSEFPQKLAHVASPSPRPDQVAIHVEVRAAVLVLPERHRTMLLRLFWENSTQAEVATSLNLTQSGVNRRKASALKLLRERL